MEDALQLVPKEAVAEDGKVLGKDAVLRAWGGLAGVDVLEKEGPAAVVDVVFELFAGEAADFGPLLRGEFQWNAPSLLNVKRSFDDIRWNGTDQILLNSATKDSLIVSL